MVALSPAPAPTTAALAADGVIITLVSAGLVAPRVDLVAPRHLRPVVQAALAWRIAAMRAQLVARRLGAVARTLVAVPDLALPLAPVVTWRGQVTDYGRTTWQTRMAQRPEGGWCASCGEAHATRGEVGDCGLCNAARIAALRAEGLLAAATPAPVQPTYPTEREPYDTAGLRAPTTVPAREPWTCDLCGFENTGRRRDVEGCGPCTNREDATLDMGRLGDVRHAL